MIKANVTLHGNWGAELLRKVDRYVPEELRAASHTGAEVSSQIADRRHRTGKMAEMEVLDVTPTTSGWEGGFKSKAFYAVFQNKGTKSGITGLHFLDKGRTEAKKDLVHRLNRRLGSA